MRHMRATGVDGDKVLECGAVDPPSTVLRDRYQMAYSFPLTVTSNTELSYLFRVSLKSLLSQAAFLRLTLLTL